ncbi:MAG: type VI secretion protein IcmF/TssM N-terminal domain-containing protein [Desulfobacterales bacterium]|nr:type VI secretion protein IcmF/TssM N-terminal domain-containing protein [Desulfobacterales bacterium]
MKLAHHLPYVISGVISLILVVATLIVFIFRSAEKKASEKQAAQRPDQPSGSGEPVKKPDPPARFSALELRKSFSAALKLLKSSVSDKNFRYHMPWILMLGQSQSGKTTALCQSNLELPLGSPFGQGPEVKKACAWWMFEKGLVLDIAGDLVLRKDGATSDEKRWRQLLRLLQKHRSQRPIDGVVVTIPCTDLIGVENGNEPDLKNISQKFDAIQKKLWHAQKTLGIRFPVYVLVTRCDQIEGFSSFCHSIPERLRNNIFGWSSPYGVDVGYTDDWANQAFEHITCKLHQCQLELFTEKTDIPDKDSLFRFPASFHRLLEPVQLCLNRLFRQSIYHESFIFRGLYFCGNSTIGTDNDASSPKPFFLKDLFEKKIFQEHGLASPQRQAYLSRNRAVLVTQLVFLVMFLAGSLGLWSACSRLQADKQALLPVLQEIAEDVDKLRDKAEVQQDGLELYNILHHGSSTILFDQSALNLFKGMTRIHSLSFAFIPASWFSDIHDKINDSMVRAYDKIILKAMYIQLIHKAKAIFEPFEGREKAPSLAGGSILRIEDTPEFIRLQAFSRQLKELENYADLYNGLGETKNLNQLGQVVKYLFDIDLPEEFYKNAGYYHKALGETQYRVFDPTIFKLKAKFFTLKKLIQQFYDRLFQSNPVVDQLGALSAKLQKISTGSRSVAPDEKLILDLLDTIDQTEKLVAAPEVSWIFKDTFSLGESFDEIQSFIDQSNFLGPDLQKEICRAGEEKFMALQNTIKQIKTSLTGPLLQVENEKLTPMLSAGLLSLKSDLGNLLKQDFMTAEPMKKARGIIPAGTRPRWNSDYLNDAVKLFVPYEDFIVNGVQSASSDFQTIIGSVAKDQLESRVQDLIERSQSYVPFFETFDNRIRESELFSEIRNFKDAAKLLNYLLGYLDRLDLTDAYLSLSDTIIWQTASLLERVDSLLEADSLYNIKGKDLSWWSGTRMLSLQAFDVSDKEELINYLQLQRYRIKQLANEYAAPLISVLSNSRFLKDHQLKRIVFKWEKIISELEKYENKIPENSISTLEKFVLFEIDTIDEKNYFTKISAQQVSEQSGDIFLQKRNRIRRLLYEQCRRLATANIIDQYGKIQIFFNRQLAGKFPFTDVSDIDAASEADPEDIYDFYHRFDKEIQTVRKELENAPLFSISADETVQFLTRMDAVRQFFSSNIDKTEPFEGNIPVLDFDIDFRVNRTHEVEANRIIDWELAVGGQKFNNNDSGHIGRWRYGDPVGLSLRWAKNAEGYPVFGGDLPGVSIQDKTVVYKLSNKWSLIRFVRMHAAAASDFDKFADPEPHTLKFSIDTRSGRSLEADKKKTTAFIRLKLLSPDKKKSPLVLPVFPQRAPELQALPIK